MKYFTGEEPMIEFLGPNRIIYGLARELAIEACAYIPRFDRVFYIVIDKLSRINYRPYIAFLERALIDDFTDRNNADNDSNGQEDKPIERLANFDDFDFDDDSQINSVAPGDSVSNSGSTVNEEKIALLTAQYEALLAQVAEMNRRKNKGANNNNSASVVSAKDSAYSPGSSQRTSLSNESSIPPIAVAPPPPPPPLPAGFLNSTPIGLTTPKRSVAPKPKPRTNIFNIKEITNVQLKPVPRSPSGRILPISKKAEKENSSPMSTFKQALDKRYRQINGDFDDSLTSNSSWDDENE